jgi:hypothetical protein
MADFTVHLLRDNHTQNPGYVVFATNKDDKVIKATASAATLDYVEAATRVEVMFQALSELNPEAKISCYLENSYDRPLEVAYSLDRFEIATAHNTHYYSDLIDEYNSLLCSFDPKEAFEKLVAKKSLTPKHAKQLVLYIEQEGLIDRKQP